MRINENNLPAPSNRHQVMRYLGKSYVLDPRGETVWGPGAHDLADRKCDQLNAAEDTRKKRGKRPCMCCGEVFESEGIHNRMCNGCRARGSANMGDYSYVGGPGARRMKG